MDITKMIITRYFNSLIFLSLVYVVLAGCTNANSITQHGKEIFNSSSLSLDRPVWSRDGKSIAFSGFDAANGNSLVYLLDVNTLQVSEVYQSPRTTVQDWSPLNNNELLIASGDEVKLLKSDTKATTESMTSGTVAAWSPDGNFLAVVDKATGYRILKLWDPKEQTEEILLDQGNLVIVFDLSWSPDSKVLLFSAMDSSNDLNVDIFNFDFEKHKYNKITSGPEGHQYINPVWIAPNKILYLQRNVYDYDAFFVILNLTTNCEEKVPVKYASTFAISPDRKSVVYVLENNRMEVADTSFILDDQDGGNCK